MAEPLALAVVMAGTGAAAVIDLRTRRVPNRLTLTLAAVGLALAAAGAGRLTVPAACAGGVLGLLLMLPGHCFGATGGGDVKLFAAAGTLLGPADTVWAFVATLISGGALALLVAAHRRRLGVTGSLPAEASAEAGRFAYAPAIAAGVVMAAVFA